MTSKMLYTFLDAITCALGGVLVVFLSQLNESNDSIVKLQNTMAAHFDDMRMIAQIKGDRDAAVNKGKRLEGDLAENRSLLTAAKSREEALVTSNNSLRSDIARALTVNEKQAADLKKANEGRHSLARLIESAWQKQAALSGSNEALIAQNEALAESQRTQTRDVVGLKGKFERVAFLIDSSESMDSHGGNLKRLLSPWLKHIDFEQFNVIQFSSSVVPWKSDWEDASESTRLAAVNHVEQLQMGGQTVTKAALTYALSLDGIDTIVIFTDGAPSDGTPADILAATRPAYRKGVVINAVAIGDYFDKDYGEFLKKLAADHGGVFIGR